MCNRIWESEGESELLQKTHDPIEGDSEQLHLNYVRFTLHNDVKLSWEQLKEPFKMLLCYPINNMIFLII